MTRTAAPPSSEGAVASGWVVCLGQLRDVRHGRVLCPEIGSPVAITRCRACRRLCDVSDERQEAAACTAAPPVR
jgi:hypothetical protein